MQILFETSNPEAADLRPVAERRIRTALRRLSWLAPGVRVQLSDLNGQRGEIDKRCQIDLTTASTGRVLITSLARDWRSALQTALARAARALLHAWQRRREMKRTPRQRLAVER